MSAEHLPDSLKNIRRAIEQAVPHGRTNQVHCNNDYIIISGGTNQVHCKI